MIGSTPGQWISQFNTKCVNSLKDKFIQPTDNLNKSIPTKEIESVVKNTPTKETPDVANNSINNIRKKYFQYYNTFPENLEYFFQLSLCSQHYIDIKTRQRHYKKIKLQTNIPHEHGHKKSEIFSK